MLGTGYDGRQNRHGLYPVSLHSLTEETDGNEIIR